MALQRLLPRPVRQLGRGLLEAARVLPPVGYLTPDYPRWIAARRLRRSVAYPCPLGHARPRFDVLTLVHDTCPIVLRRTATSVLGQDYPDFRWVVLDNGSTRPGTRAVLAELGDRDDVDVLRAEVNLGIVRGHRAALSQCEGDYVALVDHDDELSPDALRIVAWHVLRHDGPALLYSDEDKLTEQGLPHCPFLKPAWSPALLQGTPYTCHLTAFRRDMAESLGLFTDDAVEGTQDWDLALRVHDSGCVGVHVPEVLYSWRMLPQSTAHRIRSKSFALTAQRHCLEASLARRGLSGRYAVQPSPIYPHHDGHWHVARRASDFPSIQMVEGELDAALGGFLPTTDAEYLAYVPAHVRRLAPDWLGEALTQLELDPRAGMAGGRVVDRRNLVVAGGGVLGLGGFASTLHGELDAFEIGYFGLALTPRNVSVLTGVPWLARRAALEDVQLTPGRSVAFQELELCLKLRAAGWRVAFTPHALGWSDQSPPRLPSGEAAELRRAWPQAVDPYYARDANRHPRHTYRPVNVPC